MAIHESSRIRPSSNRPDLIVSIGTGHISDATLDRQETAHFLRRGFLGRAASTFLYSPACDADQGWRAALTGMPEDMKDDAYRLDYPLPAPLPELDDIDQMEWLSKLPYGIPPELQCALDSKSFFFELDDDPIPSLSGYSCNGSILCCRQNIAAVLDRVGVNIPNATFMMRKHLSDAKAMTGVGSNLGRVDGHNGCESCGYYRKPVSFEVSCLEAQITVEIVGMSTSHRIGGFHSSIWSVLKDQKANTVFGRDDHQTDQWPPSRLCYCKIK